MANFVKFKCIAIGNDELVPEVYKSDILFPNTKYINTDTIELITPVSTKDIRIENVDSEYGWDYEEYEIFIIKTVSNNYYFCLKEEFNKFIQEKPSKKEDIDL